MMKIRVALFLTLVVLAVPMATFAEQAAINPQSIAPAAANTATSAPVETASECPTTSPAEGKIFAVAPLESVVALTCDSTCSTEQECDDFCAPRLGHCQIFPHCCVCF